MRKTLVALSLGLALSGTALAADDFRLVIHGGAGNIVEGRFHLKKKRPITKVCRRL